MQTAWSLDFTHLLSQVVAPSNFSCVFMMLDALDECNTGVWDGIIPLIYQVKALKGHTKQHNTVITLLDRSAEIMV
jgi:hypothetical protein